MLLYRGILSNISLFMANMNSMDLVAIEIKQNNPFLSCLCFVLIKLEN